MEICVSPNGSDHNPGTEAEPFASLQRAQKAARTAARATVREAAGATAPVTVFLRGGTHYLDEPLVLTDEDSGSPDAPVVYRSYADERVTLHGGQRLECRWEPYSDGILSCRLPQVAAGALDFGQMFANGKRQILARYPNKDDSDTENYSGYVNAAGAISDDLEDPCPDPDADMTYPNQPKRGIHFDAETFTDKHWAHPEEAVIHIYQSYYWGNLQWQIKHLGRESQTIWFGEGGHQLGAQYSHSPANVDERSRFFVENVFEELDSPGEWYLDRREGMLYWMPEVGTDPATAVIEVPRLKRVIEFRGTRRKPVHHITIERLRITGTASTFMDSYEIPSLGDWALCRDGSVLLEGTRNCSIRGCWFDAVGGNGVFINRYNRDVDVAGCTFSETGDSAVCLVGEYETTTGTQKPFPYECRVENNHIHDCGEFGKQIAGVYISRAKRITAGHNLIHDMSRAGICIGDGTWGGHVIEHNHIHDTCRQTHDHGPFNSWGRERYWSLVHSHFGPNKGNCIVAGDVKFDAMEPTLIRNNYFVEHKGWGIDLDDGSSNYELYNNICIGVSVKLREGAYRSVYNNIWINPANPPSFHVGNIDNHDRYYHNITVTNPAYSKVEHDFNFRNATTGNEIYAITMPPATGPWLEEVDNNCYWNPPQLFTARIRPREGEPHEIDLAQWQSLGFDHHSVCADPKFVDPDSGDYRVSADSPALQVGFENFEMGTWGLTDKFKPW
jgi:hypothetical protein